MNTPAVYEDFLALVKDFSQKKIKFSTVVTKLSDLFHEHPEHIESFSEFMTDDRKAKLRKLASELKNVSYTPHIRTYLGMYWFTMDINILVFR